MIRVTLLDYTDEKMTEAKALFDFAVTQGWDCRISFEKDDLADPHTP